MQSSTPKVLLPSVWPLPVSLAATSGISFDFSSSAYLDVSVQRVSPPMTILFTIGWQSIALPCFHIRISADLCLFAAPRSFSQLITSFIGSWCQGIPLVLFLAWPFFTSLTSNVVAILHFFFVCCSMCFFLFDSFFTCSVFKVLLLLLWRFDPSKPNSWCH